MRIPVQVQACIPLFQDYHFSINTSLTVVQAPHSDASDIQLSAVVVLTDSDLYDATRYSQKRHPCRSGGGGRVRSSAHETGEAAQAKSVTKEGRQPRR